MDRKYKLLLVFILVALVQLYIPGKMILDSEGVIDSGIAYKFKTAPVDPTDPFRGKYITLRYKDNSLEVENESDWISGEEIYVILRMDKDGFAKIKFISKEAPEYKVDYFKAKIRSVSSNQVRISYPFNRYYMEESKAEAAEKAYRRSQADTRKLTYALVSIKDGEVVLQDVLIDGVSIKDIVEKENEEWKHIFDKRHIKGTFVLKNMSTGDIKIYNSERSDSTYLPASTFKILNSMIALQSAAIKSVDDTIKWDGVDRGFAAWNKDHTMRTAMPVSCVWFYQELARRIGKEQMQYWVNQVAYGNKNIGKGIDDFWLEGDIRISANEQVAFIEKLINNQLPFDTEIQETVKELMVTDSAEKYTMHSKTGWTNQIGWNMGYIDTKNNRWIFAMNQDILQKQDAKYRKEITYEILKTEKIID
ncbi:class D beta-lactamase [Ancylomarina sp. YFZ004]